MNMHPPGDGDLEAMKHVPVAAVPRGHDKHLTSFPSPSACSVYNSMLVKLYTLRGLFVFEVASHQVTVKPVERVR